jgi:hypothetical protein
VSLSCRGRRPVERAGQLARVPADPRLVGHAVETEHPLEDLRQRSSVRRHARERIADLVARQALDLEPLPSLNLSNLIRANARSP